MESPSKVPESLKSDPFWNETLTHSHSTFGAASKGMGSARKDKRYNIEQDVDAWSPMDKFGVHHKRLQVESAWGKYSLPPGAGEYDPDFNKESKHETFIVHSFPSKPVDSFFSELELKRTQPPPKVMGGLPDLFAKRKAFTATDNSFSAGDFKNVSVEDMRNGEHPALR